MRKIAFVTPGYDPSDVRRGSGTFYHLAAELEHQGCRLHRIGPLSVQQPLLTRLFSALTRRVLKGRYLTYLDPWFARVRCRVLAEKLASEDYEMILTNDHGIAAENLTGKPVVLYTDMMLRRSYDGQTRGAHTPLNKVPAAGLHLFRRTVRRSLRRAALCVFPAEWQRQAAVEFRIPSDKIVVIPFGANIPDPGPGMAQRRSLEAVTKSRQLELLFVGKDWLRKGGPIAMLVAAGLRDAGIETTLHVVGAQLAEVPKHVRCHGLLDKNDRSAQALLDRLYRDCHVLVLPSVSEGYGIAPHEAAAYGMPMLAYRIDALRGRVDESAGAVLLDIGAPPAAFVGVILGWLAEPAAYRELAVSARALYEDLANWPTAVTALLGALDRVGLKGTAK